MSAVTPFPLPTRSTDTGSARSAETGWSLLIRNGLFRNAPVAMAQCDGGGAITAANVAFERLLGAADGAAAQPRLLSELVPLPHREEMETLMRQLSESERASFQIERPMQPKNGEEMESSRWLRWTLWKAAAAEAGSVCGIIAEDTTASHYTERRRGQAGRMEALGRLASGVAHDFNNLLTGVILYSDLLLAGLEENPTDERPGVRGLRLEEREERFEGRLPDGAASRERLRNYAGEIRAAGVQGSGLVRQLLAIARPANEAAHLLSLNTMAEGMRQLLQRLIGENIELVYELDGNLGGVRMDSSHAQQILLNLVLNARDAMPEGGRITVETRNCGLRIVGGGRVGESGPVELPCVLFVVRDNGQGIDRETKQRVFDAFFSTKPEGEGTGLGLSTVREIVTNNGGLIHLDSAPLQGTRVSVLLPLVPGPMDSVDRSAVSAISGPANSRSTIPISQTSSGIAVCSSVISSSLASPGFISPSVVPQIVVPQSAVSQSAVSQSAVSPSTQAGLPNLSPGEPKPQQGVIAFPEEDQMP